MVGHNPEAILRYFCAPQRERAVAIDVNAILVYFLREVVAWLACVGAVMPSNHE
jgi:hypothetical protein